MRRALCLLVLLVAAPGCMMLDELFYDDGYYQTPVPPVVPQCGTAVQAASLPVQTTEPPR